MSLQYHSTRGGAPALDFEGVLLAGLARDGGLYLPQSLPSFSAAELRAMRSMSYSELATTVIAPFVEGSIDRDTLSQLVESSYRGFRHTAVAPIKQLDRDQWLLELFHGPTLAFKDFALQLLGRLLDHVLTRRNEKVVIMGATSGDTGSAAIEGCRHSDHVDIFILYPDGRVSDVQRRQMTTVPGDNIRNLAIRGNFDDCQALVKASFVAEPFLPEGRSLVAVNSINWARIMAQIVYYFYAAFAVGGPDRPVNFSVPTGNFGDIYAGYLAKKMGLPVDRLVIATNKNDILHRFISNNQYNLGPLEPSLSPSMDIMVSSNFERFLFDLFEGDTGRVESFVTSLSDNAQQVSETEWNRARRVFDSCRVDDEATCATIKDVFEEFGYVLDPHSATGIRAGRECRGESSSPMICLATAHPAKFSEAIERAGLETPPLPEHMADLMSREERMTILPASLDAITGFIQKTL